MHLAPRTDVRAGMVLDVAATGLVVVLAAWTALVAGDGRGRSSSVVLLLAGLAVAVVVGRRAGRLIDLPGAVAAAIGGALVLTYPGLLSAAGAPTGYANANATLGAVGVLASVAAAQRAPRGRARQGWAGLSAALVAATLLTRSTAGIVVLVSVAILWRAATRLRWPALVAAGGAVVVALTLALTVAMAIDGSVPLAGVDPVRVELWSAAVELAGEDPVRGLGAGAFEDRNPVTGDDDLRWVHHEYLELAVELGGVGLVLVVALGLAVLARLAAGGARGTAAAAVLVVVALHGAVDHVWHTPAALIPVALLVGDGMVGRSSGVDRRTDGGDVHVRPGPEGHCR